MFRKFFWLLLMLCSSYIYSLGLGTDPQGLEEKVKITPDRFGRSFCTDQPVKIEFTIKPGDELDTFTYKPIFADERNLTQKKCPPKIEETDPDKKKRTFNKNNLQVSSALILPPSICPNAPDPNFPGGVGTSWLCIYNQKNQLVASSLFGYNTRVASIKGLPKDKKAFNKEVSFTLEFNPGSGNISFEVCFGKDKKALEADKDCKNSQRKMDNKPSITIDKLEDEVEYFFKARTLDDKIYSAWGPIFEATPQAVNFPLDDYNGKGGDLQFSCQQTGSSGWILLFTLAMLLAFRFRKIIPGLFIACFIFLNSTDMRAEPGQMNFGILGSMYRPDLDSEKVGSGTVFPFYACHFKKNKEKDGPITPLMGVEADWHLWDGFGSLQLGFGLSYTYVKGHALVVKNGQPQCDNKYNGAGAALHMYQIRPQLTYIFDPFIEVFPFAPYVRAALVGQGYIFTHEGKDLKSNTIKPNGFRFGYQVALGLMFMLDFLEKSAVSSAFSAGLFEHVYLKAELSYTKIDSFGSSGFQFSPKDVMGTSWPLLWTFGLVFQLPN
jgi:hypothetical protein